MKKVLFVLAASLLVSFCSYCSSAMAAQYSTGVELLDKFFFPYASCEKTFVWNNMLAELKEAGFPYRTAEGMIVVYDPENPGYVFVVTPIHNVDGSHYLIELDYFGYYPPSYERLNGVKVEFRDSGDLYYVDVDKLPTKQMQVGSLRDIEAYLRERLAGGSNTGSISRRGVVLGDGVRMRTAPNTNAAILHRFGRNTTLDVWDSYQSTHERYPWYRVRYQNDVGWMYGEFLKLDYKE